MQKTAQVAEKFVTESNTPFFLMVNYPDAHLPFHRQQFGLPKVPYEAEDVETLPFVGLIHLDYEHKQRIITIALAV